MSVQRVDVPSAQVAQQIGQATAVEQARAVAEVQAAIVVAQQVPRTVATSVGQMEEACSQPALAERAFFRFPRGDTTVSGPSIHLARELARCWGNVQYGVQEMRRDDRAGISEMQAWAWDVQTNTRSSHVFIVPHKRDQRGGPKQLVDMRDIYENNANNGARRLREAIFAVLPIWYTERAKELCAETIRKGGGQPLDVRIANALKEFGRIGVTLEEIEQKLGRDQASWTEHDVAQLSVSFKSIQRGEVSRVEEFPPVERRVTAGEIVESVGGGAALSEEHTPAPGTGSGEAVDREAAGGEGHPVASSSPEPASPEPEEPSGPEITPETAAACRERIKAVRDAGLWNDVSKVPKAEGIPLNVTRMTEPQGQRFLELVPPPEPVAEVT